jgi:fructokinase
MVGAGSWVGRHNSDVRIGIDVGGTKIEGLALDESGERARVRIATPRGDYEATLDAIASVVGSLEKRAGERGSVGIGIPGTLVPATGLVKNANSRWLNDRPFHADLERHLQRPVRMANDANCFALSETVDGAAAGCDVVFGVILGTGVGGGIVVRGAILTGEHGLAGEWGHNPLPAPDDDERPGPQCYCGRSGCIEMFLSGPGLARDFEQRTGQTLIAQEIVARAAQREEDGAAARAALERYEYRLARALASIINVLDPETIVLGGGMSNVERLYTNVPRLWAPWVFGADREGSVRTRLLPPRHGDSSGVRGAAWLWSR